MGRSLQEELKQSKPFPSREAEAVLSIARTAAVLEAELAEVLRPYGLTPTQYNVLRILRGTGERGLCRFEVSERLVTPGPDVTRLLDRLESVELVDRMRDVEDRRQVRTQITPRGMDLLRELDQTLEELHRRQVGRLGPERLVTLIEILSDVRDR